MSSEIARYYTDKSIFITGATGFLGKVLIEKLLRSCPDVKNIYVLVRHKKGNTPQQRIDEILNCPLYDVVCKSNPGFRSKLVAIEGDLLLPAMGISQEDEMKLIDNVNIVFHSAATVRFDEPIKDAIQMNVVGTKKIIDLCRKVANLEALVHVSTAYANCNRKHISEKVYKSPMNPTCCMNATEWMSDETSVKISPIIIGKRPNTYTYTKAITESLVINECSNRMPCAIVRPSIVGASWQEPFPGWIDNYNGPTALFAASGKGILRSIIGDKKLAADLIPVDYTANMIIAAGWSIGTRTSKSKKIPVYNLTTGGLNKITWAMIETNIKRVIRKNPFEKTFLVPDVEMTIDRWQHTMRHVIQELLPSFFMDLYLKMIGKKPMYIKLQKRMCKVVNTLEFFTTHEWVFTNENIIKIQQEMNETDRKMFYLDVKEIDWDVYIENYCLGVKKFLLKEDTSELRIDKCRTDLTNMVKMKNMGTLLFQCFFLVLLMFFCSHFFLKLFKKA